MSWVDEARALDCWGVAQSLGLTVRRGRRFGPCPVCGEGADGSGRPACRVMRSNRWICNAAGGCHSTGDVLDLVALVRHGCRAPELGSRFRELRAILGGEVEVRAEIPDQIAPDYAPEEELRAVLAASTPVHRVGGVVGAWLDARRLGGQLPAWRLPTPAWPGWRGISWWPRSWARDDRWPVAVPAYSPLGVLHGLHGRAVVDDVPSKTRWGRGVSARGLIFADPWTALPGLRGEGWAGRGS